MATKVSAGLLLYRRRAESVQVLIAHPGGPFFARKHEGAWTVPKGEVEDGEYLLAAARREFVEETGFPLPSGAPLPLGSVRQRSGKRVHAWALEGDCDADALVSNRFEMEWPRRSGRLASFPEIDRVQWASPEDARRLLNAAQVAFIDRLLDALRPPA